MGSLFSSPSKQASQVASADQGISEQSIASYLQNYNSAENTLRSNIPAGSQNPYFNAAGQMDPSKYKVDPTNTQTVSAPPPPQQGNGAPNAFATPQQGPPQRQMPPQQPPVGNNVFAQAQLPPGGGSA